MDQQWKKRWVEALRRTPYEDGFYVMGTGRLHSSLDAWMVGGGEGKVDCFCALGVLLNEIQATTEEDLWTESDDMYEPFIRVAKLTEEEVSKVWRTNDDTNDLPSDLNERHKALNARMADWVEANL